MNLKNTLVHSFTLFLLLTTSSLIHADALQDGVDAAKLGDFKTAISLWQPLANRGTTKAEYYLGRLYRNVPLKKAMPAHNIMLVLCFKMAMV